MDIILDGQSGWRAGTVKTGGWPTAFVPFHTPRCPVRNHHAGWYSLVKIFSSVLSSINGGLFSVTYQDCNGPSLSSIFAVESSLTDLWWSKLQKGMESCSLSRPPSSVELTLDFTSSWRLHAERERRMK